MTATSETKPDLPPDGGPAFPRVTTNAFTGGARVAAGSMSLRDWFAGQALTGLATLCGAGAPDYPFEELAADAFRAADAMLAVRGER